MKENELETHWKKLQETLEQIKALLAWEQLQREERRAGQPPGFTLTDPVDEDLRNQYSRFLTLSQQMHGILNSSARNCLSAIRQRSYMQQVLRLEQEIRSLALGERFITL
jgi:hypothetical protein